MKDDPDIFLIFNFLYFWCVVFTNQSSVLKSHSFNQQTLTGQFQTQTSPIVRMLIYLFWILVLHKGPLADIKYTVAVFFGWLSLALLHLCDHL